MLEVIKCSSAKYGTLTIDNTYAYELQFVNADDDNSLTIKACADATCASPSDIFVLPPGEATVAYCYGGIAAGDGQHRLFFPTTTFAGRTIPDLGTVQAGTLDSVTITSSTGTFSSLTSASLVLDTAGASTITMSPASAGIAKTITVPATTGTMSVGVATSLTEVTGTPAEIYGATEKTILSNLVTFAGTVKGWTRVWGSASGLAQLRLTEGSRPAQPLERGRGPGLKLALKARSLLTTGARRGPVRRKLLSGGGWVPLARVSARERRFEGSRAGFPPRRSEPAAAVFVKAVPSALVSGRDAERPPLRTSGGRPRRGFLQ